MKSKQIFIPRTNQKRTITKFNTVNAINVIVIAWKSLEYGHNKQSETDSQWPLFICASLLLSFSTARPWTVDLETSLVSEWLSMSIIILRAWMMEQISVRT